MPRAFCSRSTELIKSTLTRQFIINTVKFPFSSKPNSDVQLAQFLGTGTQKDSVDILRHCKIFLCFSTLSITYTFPVQDGTGHQRQSFERRIIGDFCASLYLCLSVAESDNSSSQILKPGANLGLGRLGSCLGR